MGGRLAIELHCIYVELELVPLNSEFKILECQNPEFF